MYLLTVFLCSYQTRGINSKLSLTYENKHSIIVNENTFGAVFAYSKWYNREYWNCAVRCVHELETFSEHCSEKVNIFQTPVNTVQTPVNTVQTPVNTVQTPVNTVQTLVNTVQTPVNTVQTPVNTVQTPVDTVQTPVNTVQTPVDTVYTPENTVQTVTINTRTKQSCEQRELWRKIPWSYIKTNFNAKGPATIPTMV